ncbi:FecR domain-containing protein [Pedobacter sp. PAMC26386]|nr:FecR domain-containing protein [Pedobacter sp. PAMC26386]
MKDKEMTQYQLAEKWLNGTITADEKIQFATWYNQNSQLPLDLGDQEELLNKKMLQKILLQVHHDHSVKTTSLFKRKWLYTAAAILTGILSIVIFYQTKPVTQIYTRNNKVYSHDIGPGGNAARLTLSNGSTIILNEAKVGNLVQQSGIAIIKQNNGLLSYQKRGENDQTRLGVNILTTPKGGQYQLLLADGTKVYMNASSSLNFPVQFTGKNRTVTLKGEAYFEVAKNKDKPFIVHTEKGNIEVLGTHFNVASYTNEPKMITTLLEGSVKVSSQHHSSIITPGQQARVNQQIEISKVDVAEAIAWKNNLFIFDQSSIKEVMRQLERWYDVEITFEGNIPTGSFTGEISRNVKLSEVLKVLQFSDVNFKIDGKKVIITP